MVTLAVAAEYVGASEDDPFIILFHRAAPALIKRHMRGGTLDPSIHDVAVLQLISELWIRRNSGGGIAAFADGVPVRLARDAMVSVAPLLAPDRGLGTPG